MERKCLNCQEKVKGRSDKKFCSQQCRNDYYNQLNRDAKCQMKLLAPLELKSRA